MADQIDPVCGKRILQDAALVQARFTDWEGTRYFFCSDECKTEFDSSPKDYLGLLQNPGGGVRAGQEGGSDEEGEEGIHRAWQ